jgi:hypothetical protein
MESLRPLLRKILPGKVKQSLRKNQLRFVKVKHQSSVTNIYHCCVHKTASQWVRSLFADTQTYKYSGLLPFHYQTEQLNGFDERKLSERVFLESFPEGKVVSPLYIHYHNFEALPKPARYRAFFIARDPRDVVVSWYFSARYSHPLVKGMQLSGERQTLNSLPLEDGLVYAVEHLEDFGLFDTLASWKKASGKDSNIMFLRYEDVTGPQQFQTIETLFKHCEIPMPSSELKKLLQRYSFENISGGRKQGEEDQHSKYRKGKAGDWENHFTPKVEKVFREVTGDLVKVLGY